MDASMTYASGCIARRIAALAALVILTLGISGCNKLKSRDLLNKGVAAFKNGHSDEAIEDFKRAKELDPTLMVARLYLATAYASVYIPGAPSQENKDRGLQAIQEFKDVLEIDPKNLSAIDGIGSLLFQMAGTPPVDPKGFEESKIFHQKHIEIKPDDPEPYYWVGVIDWTLAWRANNEMRLDYNKAITLRPDYDDAMAYLNLLYRRKADMAESAAERDNLEKQADDLVEKVKEIKQKRLDQPQQSS